MDTPLNYDIICEIVKFLTLKDLCKIMLLSKALNILVKQSNIIWKMHISNKFNNQINYKDLYKNIQIYTLTSFKNLENTCQEYCFIYLCYLRKHIHNYFYSHDLIKTTFLNTNIYFTEFLNLNTRNNIKNYFIDIFNYTQHHNFYNVYYCFNNDLIIISNNEDIMDLYRNYTFSNKILSRVNFFECQTFNNLENSKSSNILSDWSNIHYKFYYENAIEYNIIHFYNDKWSPISDNNKVYMLNHYANEDLNKFNPYRRQYILHAY